MRLKLILVIIFFTPFSLFAQTPKEKGLAAISLQKAKEYIGVLASEFRGA